MRAYAARKSFVFKSQNLSVSHAFMKYDTIDSKSQQGLCGSFHPTSSTFNQVK